MAQYRSPGIRRTFGFSCCTVLIFQLALSAACSALGLEEEEENLELDPATFLILAGMQDEFNRNSFPFEGQFKDSDGNPGSGTVSFMFDSGNGASVIASTAINSSNGEVKVRVPLIDPSASASDYSRYSAYDPTEGQGWRVYIEDWCPNNCSRPQTLNLEASVDSRGILTVNTVGLPVTFVQYDTSKVRPGTPCNVNESRLSSYRWQTGGYYTTEMRLNCERTEKTGTVRTYISGSGSTLCTFYFNWSATQTVETLSDGSPYVLPRGVLTQNYYRVTGGCRLSSGGSSNFSISGNELSTRYGNTQGIWDGY